MSIKFSILVNKFNARQMPCRSSMPYMKYCYYFLSKSSVKSSILILHASGSIWPKKEIKPSAKMFANLTKTQQNNSEQKEKLMYLSLWRYTIDKKERTHFFQRNPMGNIDRSALEKVLKSDIMSIQAQLSIIHFRNAQKSQSP